MNPQNNIAPWFLVIAFFGGVILGVFALATGLILCGGWVLAWLIPSIPFEFACVISGLGLLVTGLLLAVAARVCANIWARHESQIHSESEETDDADDVDYEREEVVQWMAERIADITCSRMQQMSASEPRFTAKARRK